MISRPNQMLQETYTSKEGTLLDTNKVKGWQSEITWATLKHVWLSDSKNWDGFSKILKKTHFLMKLHKMYESTGTF